MEKNLKKYEIGFWVASEQGRENIARILKNQQAEIVEPGSFSRMKLAYPINKMTSAFFGYIHFTASQAAIKKMKDAISLDKEILRSIIVFPVVPSLSRKEPIAGEKRSFSPRSRIEAGSSFAAAAATQKPRVAAKNKSVALSNEELEKKLEEMLK